MERRMTKEQIQEYERYLCNEEKSRATLEKYRRDLLAFFNFLPQNKQVNKAQVIDYKEYISKRYAPTSVNSMLAALNGFFIFHEWFECRIKPLKIQRRVFAAEEKELNRREYIRLLEAAQKNNNERLMLIMETICATGIRVSELSFITTEALYCGRAVVRCKGKSRLVFLPRKLCSQLRRYAQNHQLKGGPIFVTRNGRPLDRSNIWSDMKALCHSAGVAPSKVFPHNLRHLFAKTYYDLEKDLGRLADLLGHSNVETTRIYTQTSGAEHERQVDRLGLVI